TSAYRRTAPERHFSSPIPAARAARTSFTGFMYFLSGRKSPRCVRHVYRGEPLIIHSCNMRLHFTNHLLVLGLIASAACAETITPPAARIAQFDGDRAAAISYTFDDNLRDQYTLAVPMLNEAGFKGTFFVIAGKTAETPEDGEKRKDDGNVRNLWGGIS